MLSLNKGYTVKTDAAADGGKRIGPGKTSEPNHQSAQSRTRDYADLEGCIGIRHIFGELISRNNLPKQRLVGLK